MRLLLVLCVLAGLLVVSGCQKTVREASGATGLVPSHRG